MICWYLQTPLWFVDNLSESIKLVSKCQSMGFRFWSEITNHAKCGLLLHRSHRRLWTKRVLKQITSILRDNMIVSNNLPWFTSLVKLICVYCVSCRNADIKHFSRAITAGNPHRNGHRCRSELRFTYTLEAFRRMLETFPNIYVEPWRRYSWK